MKNLKYLVFASAAILAVGCSNQSKMPKVEDADAVKVASKIVTAHSNDFSGVTMSLQTIDDWHKWNAPKQFVSVTATDSTNVVSHVAGYVQYDNTHTATRTLRYDLDAHRIQYIYDANFYDASSLTGVIPDYRPGKDHRQYDYIWTPGEGLWCCSDENGYKNKTKADWGYWWDEDYQIINTDDAADAWVKYAYVFATDVQDLAVLNLAAPIPSATHYMRGFDDMMDYFIDGDEYIYALLTDEWEGLMSWDEFYAPYYDEVGKQIGIHTHIKRDDPCHDGTDLGDWREEDETEDAYLDGAYFHYLNNLVSEVKYFDTFAQFVNNSIQMRNKYEDNFKKGKDWGTDSSAKADYYSNDTKNLNGEVAYRLDYNKEAVVDEDVPAYSYGIDYSFNYADDYLTNSKTQYYISENYLTSKGEKTDSYNLQSATKSVDISYDKPNFSDVNLKDYETYNWIIGA